MLLRSRIIREMPTSTTTAAAAGSVKTTRKADDFVRLRVGGTLFETTRATLCAYDSMLKSLVESEREHGLASWSDADGAILIDRSGRRFEHVLNFMRDGTLAPGYASDTIGEIAAEAKFYCFQVGERCAGGHLFKSTLAQKINHFFYARINSIVIAYKSTVDYYSFTKWTKRLEHAIRLI